MFDKIYEIRGESGEMYCSVPVRPRNYGMEHRLLGPKADVVLQEDGSTVIRGLKITSVDSSTKEL